MQLRRFTAETTPAALGAVRLAFGDDAIILANRRLGDMVEIIATGNAEDVASLSTLVAQELADEPSVEELARDIDSIADEQSALQLQPAQGFESDTVALSTAAQAQTPKIAVNTDIEQIPAESPEDSERFASSADSQHSASNTADSAIARVDPSSVGSTASPAEQNMGDSSCAGLVTDSDEKTGDIENCSAVERQIWESSIAATMLSKIEDVMQLQQARIEQRLRSMEVNMWGMHSPTRSVLLRKLFALGIGAELAVRLIERVDPDKPVDEAMRQSLALLKSTIPIARDKSLSEPGVTLFTGPPGCGKTTAMFKMATQYVKQSGNQSIVVIGADIGRIGAFDELQAYGKLLGVPTVQAASIAELETTVAAFSHKNLILIDYGLPDSDLALLPATVLSAGRSSALRQLFVLPSNIQAVTAESLLSHHGMGKTLHCVLTHLDTSARLGELFNALIRNHVPVAYWSDTKSVHSPLHGADASVLVATAVAMSRRAVASADDDWLQQLIQPSQHLFQDAPLTIDNARSLQA